MTKFDKSDKIVFGCMIIATLLMIVGLFATNYYFTIKKNELNAELQMEYNISVSKALIEQEQKWKGK